MFDLVNEIIVILYDISKTIVTAGLLIVFPRQQRLLFPLFLSCSYVGFFFFWVNEVDFLFPFFLLTQPHSRIIIKPSRRRRLFHIINLMVPAKKATMSAEIFSFLAGMPCFPRKKIGIESKIVFFFSIHKT